MPHHTSPAREAAIYARAVEQELTQLRKALREAEDNLAGLHRMLKAPVPKGGSRTIKGSRTKLSLLDRAAQASFGSLTNTIVRDIGSGSFYDSAASAGSGLLAALQLGQRIS